MARPGLMKHPKFRKLCLLTGEPKAHCRGYLECLWDVAYESGEPIIGDKNDIEMAAEWPGKTGKLFRALLKCGGEDRAGFIENVENRPEEFQIHDLFDHAPDYVLRRRSRELARKKGRSFDNKDLQQKLTDHCPVTDQSVAESEAQLPEQSSTEQSSTEQGNPTAGPGGNGSDAPGLDSSTGALGSGGNFVLDGFGDAKRRAQLALCLAEIEAQAGAQINHTVKENWLERGDITAPKCLKTWDAIKGANVTDRLGLFVHRVDPKRKKHNHATVNR